MVPVEDVEIVAVRNKRTRYQKIDFPTDGILKITVQLIGINPSQEYVRTQRSTEHTLEYASSVLDNVNDISPSLNSTLPIIRAEELHKLIVNFFSSNASSNINLIANMDHQKGFIDDAHAEFNYRTFGPLVICQKKRVSLVTDPAL